MAEATYTKLRSGDWGVRVVGEVAAGQEITVKKKDDSTKTETVKNIIFKGEGFVLCGIEQRERGSGSGRSYSRGGGHRRGSGCSCDDDCCERGCRCHSDCNCQGGPIYDC